jgi:hypothetical protein
LEWKVLHQSGTCREYEDLNKSLKIKILQNDLVLNYFPKHLPNNVTLEIYHSTIQNFTFKNVENCYFFSFFGFRLRKTFSSYLKQEVKTGETKSNLKLK